jgi:Fur family transcriptional regulator, peroxide stress response regulator
MLKCLGQALEKGKSRMVSKGNKKEGRGDKLDMFRQVCRDKGLKVTPQRTAVYRALVETDEHPSAESVFHKVREVFPNISLDTVNRTLLTLNEVGLALAVEGSGDAKRFDGDMGHHQHFKCIRCKRIIDFHYEPFDRISVPESLADKFTVLRTTVYVEGLCDECRSDSHHE